MSESEAIGKCQLFMAALRAIERQTRSVRRPETENLQIIRRIAHETLVRALDFPWTMPEIEPEKNEQPLFDVEALRKIDAQPGDAFVLELPIEYAEPDKEELERIGAKLKSVLGEQVKVIIPPPGTKLRRVPGPYYYRRQVQGVEEEIGFATHAEMMAYLKKDEPQVATAEEIEKLQAKFLKVYAENPLQAMFLPPVAEYKPLAQPPIAVQWHGNMPSVVRVEEPAPSLKEANTAHAAEAANVVKKPLAQPGEKGGYAVPREVALHAVESGVLPPDAILPVEPQADEPHKIQFREWL